MTLLSVTDLVKRYGGLHATDHLDLSVRRGDIHALIGPNGAGKTTFIGQLSGTVMPDSGSIVFDGVDVTREPPHRRAAMGIARSYQITSVFLEMTVLDNVAVAVQAVRGHSFRFWRPLLDDASVVTPALQLLAQTGLSSQANLPTHQLAHGERRQLELAMTLASSPKLLLLDEPMAGMSKQNSMDMLALLRGLKDRYTMLLVEHDMDVVFALADRITVLVAGRAIETGTPAQIRASEAVRAAYLGGEEDYL